MNEEVKYIVQRLVCNKWWTNSYITEDISIAKDFTSYTNDMDIRILQKTKFGIEQIFFKEKYKGSRYE